MVTIHGEYWHREVHSPLLWVCPLCNDDDATFSRPQDLTEHMTTEHEGTFTEPQIQAIVRQSRLQSPRQQDICLLCCLPIRGEEEPSSKKLDSKEWSPENAYNKESLEPKLKRLKTETDDTNWAHFKTGGTETATEQQGSNIPVQSFQSQRLNREMIANHVAAHLQGVMLLTLRLISINDAVDFSADDQSVSGITDYDSSRVGSGQKDPMDDNMDDNMDIGESLPEGGDTDSDNNTFEIIPDSASDCWHDVVHHDVVPMENDEVLRGVKISGAFQSHLVKHTSRDVIVGFISLTSGTDSFRAKQLI